MRESSQKLHDAITAAITPQLPSPEQLQLLAKVANDYYNDYFGVPDMPQHALVGDLRMVGLDQLAPRVIAGEFDGTKAEAAEWMRSTEGEAAMKDLGRAFTDLHGPSCDRPGRDE